MANGLTMRSSIEGLEGVPGGLDALRDAYGKMQQLKDNRGWSYWAGIHGFPQFLCWHEGRVGRDRFPYDLFLPWHRAYLHYWEHTARDQNDGAALPWWDWTSDSSHTIGIPDSFSVPQVNGKDNPLASGPVLATSRRDPARSTQRAPDDPGNLPSADDVQRLMPLGNYVDFSNQLQDMHNNVHVWVGGDMGTTVKAAFDPIFWSHHCMIDRIWYLWQLQNGVNNIPADYLDKPLSPFDLTVQDVLDINRLGYEYAQSAQSAPGTTNGG
jgi:tyrosinase